MEEDDVDCDIETMTVSTIHLNINDFNIGPSVHLPTTQ